MGSLKVEILMVGLGVNKAFSEHRFCSIGFVLWVRLPHNLLFLSLGFALVL
jgi:hypothetical protein